MTTARPTPRLLPTELISPRVDLADCWQFEANHPFRYRCPVHHLILVESGCLRGQPPGAAEFDARAGDLICFRPTPVNRYLVVEPSTFYQAGIRFGRPPRQNWTPLLGDLGPWPVVVSLGERYPAARRVFETLWLEVSRGDAVSQARLRVAVWELLMLVTETVAQHAPPGAGLDDWERLRLRLVASLREELPIAQLARERGLNLSHFIRQFKRRFGLSPKAYLTHARLHEAVRLLRSTDRPAKSIAFELGFPSVQSFARLFKHHLGLRPLESRSQPLFISLPPGTATQHPFQLNRHTIASHLAALGPDWTRLRNTPPPERPPHRPR